MAPVLAELYQSDWERRGKFNCVLIVFVRWPGQEENEQRSGWPQEYPGIKKRESKIE